MLESPPNRVALALVSGGDGAGGESISEGSDDRFSRGISTMGGVTVALPPVLTVSPVPVVVVVVVSVAFLSGTGGAG